MRMSAVESPRTWDAARKPVRAQVRSFHWCSKLTPALKEAEGRKSNDPSPGRLRVLVVTIPPTCEAPSLKSCWSRSTPYWVRGSAT